ncbi:hypothetical protein [Pseudomonas nitroreducens]|uniref:hypothetical protein n=1 Tax=Pseudomonas nitroreducens TaxID=46680 RepID=UPI002D7F68C4|nr:hypothetical protein [Pseudomonas nitroreducens]
MTPDDLDGLDVAWIAVDALGQVAIFTTGGAGTVPFTAVASIDITELEVDLLPETSGFDLLVNLPRPDDFVRFAKRGFFAYDWSDVHRVTQLRIEGYELQARPLRPLTLKELPASMQLAAAATELPDVSFGALVIPAALLKT